MTTTHKPGTNISARNMNTTNITTTQIIGPVSISAREIWAHKWPTYNNSSNNKISITHLKWNVNINDHQNKGRNNIGSLNIDRSNI